MGDKMEGQEKLIEKTPENPIEKVKEPNTEKFQNIKSPEDKQKILNQLKEFQQAKNAIIQINNWVIKKYGGTADIRSETEVEMTITKDSIYDQCEYIIKNNPFTDGNKRTAVALWFMYKMKINLDQLNYYPIINGVLKLLGNV